MRILMLAQNYAPIVGGEERMVEALSVALVRRGHDVAVATIRHRDGPHDAGDGVRLYPLPSSAYRARRAYRGAERPHAPPAPDPSTVFALKRVLQRERPDVVHGHNWLVHSYLPFDRRSDAALVLSLHDYSLLCATKRFLRGGAQCSGPGPAKCIRCAGEYYGGPKGAAIALGTLTRGPVLRRHVDMFLPVSRAVRDLCGLGPGDRYRVVPNFVLDRAAAPVDDRRLESLPREPFILYLGDARLDKGAVNLAEAYRTLSGPPPLVFVGRCYVPEIAHVPGVRLTGVWPHDLGQEALRRCLFAVVPSVVADACPVVALECAAAAKAIVASDIGGLRDTVVDGETGLLVAPGDREALRAALARLINDDDLRMRIGQAAAARRAESFSADAVVPVVEECYVTAIDARRRSRSSPQ